MRHLESVERKRKKTQKKLGKEEKERKGARWKEGEIRRGSGERKERDRQRSKEEQDLFTDENVM